MRKRKTRKKKISKNSEAYAYPFDEIDAIGLRAGLTSRSDFEDATLYGLPDGFLRSIGEAEPCWLGQQCEYSLFPAKDCKDRFLKKKKIMRLKTFWKYRAWKAAMDFLAEDETLGR